MKEVPLPFTKRLTLKDLEFKKKINVDLLVNHLKNDGKVRVDAAIGIAKKAAELFREESNVVTLKAPITMFGDIHGQFHDLVSQTAKLAKPCPEDPWLFLGDYVDRGLFGVEVVLYLFALKIQNPKGVYLIRGNHECRHLTAAYNFKKECLAKYKNLEFYDMVMEAFDALPLGALVDGGNNNTFLCVHGGLSPDIKTIQDIQNLNRFGEPPQSGPMCDILWSDPLEDGTANNLQPSELEEWYAVEYFENENRGAGYIFGYTAVMEFLKTNNLASIIRAHDVQRSGYAQQFMHCKEKRKLPLVITLFSAPNYCGYYGNEAAVLRIEYAKLTGEPPEIPEIDVNLVTNTTQRINSEFDEPPRSPCTADTESETKSEVNGDSEQDSADLSAELSNQDDKDKSFKLTMNFEQETYTTIGSDEEASDIKSFPSKKDPSAPYYPTLIYSQYNWVDDIPYFLPNFENGIQHTIPLIAEKLQSITECIRDLCREEDEDEGIPFAEYAKKEIKQSVSPPQSKSPLSLSGGRNSSPSYSPHLPAPPPTTPVMHPMDPKSFVDVNWITDRIEKQNLGRKVSERIKDYEINRRVPFIVGNAMQRRKSVQALSGSFIVKMRSYLSLINSPFDQIKVESRGTEFRPPVY